MDRWCLAKSVTDRAVVTGTGAGTPTGSVTFTFYSALNCAGTGVTGAAVALVGGVANSLPTAALGAGDYGFIAHYGGDTNYKSSDGVCEPFQVNKAPSGTLTTVQQGGTDISGPLVLGSAVTDRAIVSGTGAGAPTGSVTFTFYSALNCAGPGVTGAAVALVGGVANSLPTAALGAGDYGFIAHYGGDTNYTSSDGVCEPFMVNKAPSSTLTTVQQNGLNITGQLRSPGRS